MTGFSRSSGRTEGVKGPFTAIFALFEVVQELQGRGGEGGREGGMMSGAKDDAGVYGDREERRMEGNLRGKKDRHTDANKAYLQSLRPQRLVGGGRMRRPQRFTHRVHGFCCCFSLLADLSRRLLLLSLPLLFLDYLSVCVAQGVEANTQS
jgi:hypothetical protein